MYRSFDLDAMVNVANDMLNDPYLRLQSMNISCSAETAYTTASMRFIDCEKREQKFIRKLERFVLFAGGHPRLDARLQDKEVRLIKQYVFPTHDGTVVVLDYHIRKGRQVDF
jgi:hypothetical protein